MYLVGDTVHSEDRIPISHDMEMKLNLNWLLLLLLLLFMGAGIGEWLCHNRHIYLYILVYVIYASL